jgi:acyl-coenzyme A thioesterase PaaI-like protein
VSDEAGDVAWTEHFIGALGVELWHQDGLTHGRAELRPEMLAPGTALPRLGVLATMVDIVAGCPQIGMLNPTVDLRVLLVARPPSSGTILLRCDPVKIGRRLFVGETILHTGDPDRPFARSTCTFMNQKIAETGTMFGAGPAGPLGVPSFDEILRARTVARGVLEMDAHGSVSNGPGGTIQGGAQALLGELAAVQALGDRGIFTAVDLEIRFLNRVRSESVVATADVLDDEGIGTFARVGIRDADADARLVSLVLVSCRPV